MMTAEMSENSHKNASLVGLIVKSTAGFYYVKCEDGQVYECRARGKFRNQRQSPAVGDNVEIMLGANGKGSVDKIFPRKTYLDRPCTANADKLVIISSVASPVPSMYVIDKLTAIATDREIEPIVVFSKSDLGSADELVKIYLGAGIDSFSVSCETGENLDRFASLFDKKICVLTGNTGVGKSSLINAIDKNVSTETGEISKKLGRGRHTTRTTELYEFGGGYIADTPGFSSIEALDENVIDKSNLMFCFPEFEEYIGKCKFVSCNHIGEKGCKIVEAVESGKISRSRYDSYLRMYDEVKDQKDWEKNK